jgi:hypothetical protein
VIKEDLYDKIKKQDGSGEAKKLGLSHVGFGQYKSSGGDVSHIAGKNKLLSIGEPPKEKPAKPGEKKENPNQHQYDLASVQKEVERRQKALEKETEASFKKNSGELSKFYQSNIFSPDELESILDYTSDHEKTKAVNRYLYRGFDQDEPPDFCNNIVNTISNIDSSFQDTGSPIDYPIYVGLSPRYDPAKIKSGNQYIFRGYTHGSMKHNNVQDMFMFTGGSALLEINIKKGQKSLFLDNLTGTKNGEVVLPRGTRIKIDKDPVSFDMINEAEMGDVGAVNVFKCSIIDE